MFGWFKRGAGEVPSPLPLYFHNALGNKREEFKSLGKTVKMYNCGPTVYDVQHIGNLSSSGGVFGDTIRRVLEYNGYTVKQAINITDFGHLVSDADDGEDKMTAALKKEGLPLTLDNMQKIAERYTSAFLDDIKALNVAVDRIEFPRASQYVPAQIALIKTLDEKGYAYKTRDGLYFNTKLFPRYGALGGINAESQEEGKRIQSNPEKKHPADFALWKFNAAVGWESPWGRGFPGWHIECSAMIRSILGEQIDIHTGGIEHVSIHHNNEIAQSEAASGKPPFSRYWLHRSHIQIDGRKISKSLGNTVYLRDVIAKGFDPLALRYWFLTAHYRTSANFTWEALAGAAKARSELIEFATVEDVKATDPRVTELAREIDEKRAVKDYAAADAAREKIFELNPLYQVSSVVGGTIVVKPAPIVRTTLVAAPTDWKRRFLERINDDLDTPGALAVLWDMLRDSRLNKDEKRAALFEFDKILAIGISAPRD